MTETPPNPNDPKASVVLRVPLRLLVVEDSEFDARIVVSVLRKGGYDIQFERVDTGPAMKAALENRVWDIICADYNMPEFSAPEALKVLQDAALDIPFIIISGGIGEDIAVAAMKSGAHDYLMKGNLARLVPAVERELREAKIRSSQRAAEETLRESERRYRLLWETATDAVLLMDTDGTIRFANPAVEKVLRHSQEGVVGENITNVLPGAGDLPFLQKTFSAPGTNRAVGRLETTSKRRDGSEVIVEIVSNEMEVKETRSIVLFIRDVTERRQAEQELRENEEQFRVAREIQQRLFPKESPAIAGFELAGLSHPAEATGGDYFDYLPMMHNRVGVVVGDVTGHGVGPSLLMAETRAYLRILARNRDDVGEIMTRANAMLAEDVGYERFVTLMLVQIDPVTRSLVYVSAGHPAGYVVRPDGTVRAKLKRTGIPLGIKPDNEFESSMPVLLGSGEIVLLVTDGIDEAMSPEGEFYGM
ncbi:MAG TPA: SpoIIE family protein phosphatase, partial [Roseimicrobium sp.]|nr:SpoIIE family protein phosphatase [Roseimicrobium sp.]